MRGPLKTGGLRVRRPYILFRLVLLLLGAPLLAEPPAHAPAHGYRAKQHGPHHAPERHAGFEVVFDSERGVRVVVDFPGVFFSAGSFYRHHEGHWQVSGRADGGFTVVASESVPMPIYKAHGPRPHPGPAGRHPTH
jgi:hypothetical protein